MCSETEGKKINKILRKQNSVQSNNTFNTVTLRQKKGEGEWIFFFFFYFIPTLLTPFIQKLTSVDVKSNDPGHGTKDVTLFVGVLPQMSLRCVEVRGKWGGHQNRWVKQSSFLLLGSFLHTVTLTEQDGDSLHKANRTVFISNNLKITIHNEL